MPKIPQISFCDRNCLNEIQYMTTGNENFVQ